MDNEETPAEYKDKFMLCFVDMGWVDPNMVDARLRDWTAGRMEVHTYESEHDIDEKHFCTPDTVEWRNFRDTCQLKWVNQEELEKITKTLKEKFYRVDENHNPIF